MALSLVSPPPPTLKNFQASPSTTTYPSQFPSTTRDIYRLCTSIRRREPASTRIIAKASDKDEEKPAFNPFGFVTDNPSSRSAIQLPESPAEDGNVGQMLYVSNYDQFFYKDKIIWLF